MLFAYFIFIIHVRAFLYFAPVYAAVVFFHGQLRIKNLWGWVYKVIRCVVWLISKKVLQQGSGGIVLVYIRHI